MWTASKVISGRPCGGSDTDTEALPAEPSAFSAGQGASARRLGWRAREALILVAASVLLMSLAGCGSATFTRQVPNPPAGELNATVAVFDRDTLDHTPSDRTIIIIQLARVTPSNGSSKDIIEGTEARTLACNGVTMDFDPLLIAGLAPYRDSYAVTVAPRTTAYSCVYFWDNGAQQAVITIPALRAEAPQIQTPTDRAVLAAPRPGDAGLAVGYSPQGAADANVVVTASDYNKRSATSGAVADTGAVTISASAFPAVFSVGWGTITLTRTIANITLDASGGASSFASVQLNSYEQVDQIPVFWV